MKIIGISAFYHDSAACLINDGEIVFAIQEERLSRKKHDSDFPRLAIGKILDNSHIEINSIDAFVFYEKPWTKFERIIESFLAIAPRGSKLFIKAMLIWGKEKIFQKNIIYRELRKLGANKDVRDKIFFSEHHLSHAASAYYPSPFDEALIITIDGVGEWATTTISIGRDNRIERCYQADYPHSIGLLYSAFTQYCGFKVNSGEYKLMGLAPYGEPRFVELIKENLVKSFEDGSFALNLDYFGFMNEESMTNENFHKLFGMLPRARDEKLSQFYMDIAASIQIVLEHLVVGICENAIKRFGIRNLCLAGGVALNCVANSKVIQHTSATNVWIQPAAGDAGGALGAAIAYYFAVETSSTSRKARERLGSDYMNGSYLGSSYSAESIRQYLTDRGAVFREYSDNDIINFVAAQLAAEKSVGWFQGRMEFGPRALGNRSILADPRSEATQNRLNMQVKFRESFRPFAPSILMSELNEWFEWTAASPYMLFVAQVSGRRVVPGSKGAQDQIGGLEKLKIKRSDVPAVTHIDYSARIQTVHKETNTKFHELITQFFLMTGVPMLVNTSFNVRGEPIVESPSDALRCFMGSDIDLLAIGNFVLLKEDQPTSLRDMYYGRFELD
jgi:carbamoyltransferase